jgi:hypothetical protein
MNHVWHENVHKLREARNTGCSVTTSVANALEAYCKECEETAIKTCNTALNHARNVWNTHAANVARNCTAMIDTQCRVAVREGVPTYMQALAAVGVIALLIMCVYMMFLVVDQWTAHVDKEPCADVIDSVAANDRADAIDSVVANDVDISKKNE